jgi:hypothetical protein
MAKGNGKAKSILDIPVRFGGISVGQMTSRIGVTFDRSTFDTVDDATKVFCGHRLKGRLSLGIRNEDAKQKKLVEDCDFEFEGVFDSKRLSVSSSNIGIGLTFSNADVDFSDITKFPKGDGRLIVETVEEIPANAPDEHDDEDDDNIPVVEGGEWRSIELSTMFDGLKLKAMKKAKLKTMGDMAEFTKEHSVLDLEDIGPIKAQEIEDTILAFWQKNPDLVEA